MTTNLDNEILDAMARDFAQEIDNNVMISLYEEGGWIKLVLPRFSDNYQAVDIGIWCDENIPEHEWTNFSTTFLFKYSEHAEWFTLRWLNT